jgi:CRP-like cAMP-binding protein
VSALERLRALSSLARFTDAELQILVGAATLRRVPAGEVLIREGDPGRSCLVLLEGEVEVVKRVGDIDRIISTMPTGSLLGQVALVDRSPRSATVRARGDVTVMELSRDVFETLLRAQSPLALRFQEQIAIAGARQLRQSTEALARILESTDAAPGLAPVDELEEMRISFDEWGLPVERPARSAPRRA